MYKFAIERVLAAYGIKYRRIFEPEKGYRNEVWPVLDYDGQMINVTFFKREPAIVNRINNADTVSEYLSSYGFPTRNRIADKILSLKVREQLIYIGVYQYLPGKTIPWEAYTMKHIKNLGAAMSNMHSCLAFMPLINLPSVYSEYLAIIKRMNAYFSKADVRGAMHKKLGLKLDYKYFEEYIELLKHYQHLPNQQTLHMDFVRGNILFTGTEITGILDFEKTALGHPVMDIARTLAFLLVDCKYKSNEKVRKYFLQSGYIKRGANKDVANEADLEKLIKMFLLYDFYKFLRHNPYESLLENEHYQRTKDILSGYGVISLK